MSDQFSESLIERAWQKSGGECECEKELHGQFGRCNKMLLKSYYCDQSSAYGWETHSISGKYLDTVSDIEILCWDSCFPWRLVQPTWTSASPSMGSSSSRLYALFLCGGYFRRRARRGGRAGEISGWVALAIISLHSLGIGDVHLDHRLLAILLP